MLKKFTLLFTLALMFVVGCGGSEVLDTAATTAAEVAEQVGDVADQAGDLVEAGATEVAEQVEQVNVDEDEAAEEVEVADAATLMLDDVIGTYTFEAPANDWHYAEIVQDGDRLVWVNQAGIEWTLTPDFANNLLLTDDSFPYQDTTQNYELVIEDGDYAGFLTNGDLWIYGGPAAPVVTERWSGYAQTNSTERLANVTITINGMTVETDAGGNFELDVPQPSDSRYVLGAELAGYRPESDIHVGSIIEPLVATLGEVEQFTVDPTVPIAQEDSSGTKIEIDANQLVDEDGNLPDGDVTMSMSTIDLATEDMVGDMSGTNSDGELTSMESAGAFYASFEDEAGNDLNLADGATADISIPAERTIDAPEPLTVWSYNAETGLWEEEGPAVLVDGRYVAEVNHFSYWNFDWEKREPACVKLNIEQSYLDANSPLQVRAVLQTSPVAVRDLYITDAVNVLINLPTNTDVKFYMAPDYSNAFATTNSGIAWGGVGTPAFPYDVCNGVTEIVPAPEGPTTGTIAGQVIDAVSGAPIAGAQVCIQGTSQCVDTDANGNYTIADVAPGEQLLDVKEDGYIPLDNQSVSVSAGETSNQALTLSPELAAGELRIVLTWGTSPDDLDPYLWYPSQTNPIYYDNDGKSGAASSPRLDRDDQDGEGPETITIPQQEDGSYSYAVKNHSEVGTLAESGAIVTVYQGDREIARYSAPAGDGIWWYVFDMGGATSNLTPINTLSSSAPK